MSAQPAIDLPVRLQAAEEREIEASGANRLNYALPVGLAIFLAFLIRFQMAAAAGFPVLDGGMFYTMVRDLEANHLAIPAFTTYNHAHIPFAYPPIGFYTAALVNQLTGVSVLSIIQWLPVVVSVLSIGAFALLARELVSRTAAIVAVLAFALLPDAFLNQMEGGGLTRAPGQVFGLLAVWAASVFYRTGSRRHLALLALFFAGAVLSHLEWALFTVIGIPLLWFALDRSLRGLVESGAAGIAGLALAAPWWLIVIQTHGVAPLLATVRGSASVWPWYDGILNLLTLHLTDEALFPLFGALGLLGLLVSLKRRDWLLPLWLLVIAVSDARTWSLRAVVPVCMLAGVGVDAVVLPLLRGRWRLSRTNSLVDARPTSSRVVAILAAGAILFSVLQTSIFDGVLIHSLSPGERAAMSWISHHTSPSARFLVVRGSGHWGFDAASEWFPTLTGRVSQGTVQGYEWLPGALASRNNAANALEKCTTSTSSCVVKWIRDSRKRVDYVYVSNDDDCCSTLSSLLMADPRFETVYRGPGGIVLNYRAKA